MITIEELNRKKIELGSISGSNLLVLCQRLNIVRAKWGKPMVITSGLRTPGQQENLIKQGLSKAKHSKHLVGAAADIQDVDGELAAWLLANPSVLREAQLWCEDPASTPGWVHFQIVPPASGNRWFKP